MAWSAHPPSLHPPEADKDRARPRSHLSRDLAPTPLVWSAQLVWFLLPGAGKRTLLRAILQGHLFCELYNFHDLLLDQRNRDVRTLLRDLLLHDHLNAVLLNAVDRHVHDLLLSDHVNSFALKLESGHVHDLLLCAIQHKLRDLDNGHVDNLFPHAMLSRLHWNVSLPDELDRSWRAVTKKRMKRWTELSWSCCDDHFINNRIVSHFLTFFFLCFFFFFPPLLFLVFFSVSCWLLRVLFARFFFFSFFFLSVFFLIVLSVSFCVCPCLILFFFLLCLLPLFVGCVLISLVASCCVYRFLALFSCIVFLSVLKTVSKQFPLFSFGSFSFSCVFPTIWKLLFSLFLTFCDQRRLVLIVACCPCFFFSYWLLFFLMFLFVLRLFCHCLPSLCFDFRLVVLILSVFIFLQCFVSLCVVVFCRFHLFVLVLYFWCLCFSCFFFFFPSVFSQLKLYSFVLLHGISSLCSLCFYAFCDFSFFFSLFPNLFFYCFYGFSVCFIVLHDRMFLYSLNFSIMYFSNDSRFWLPHVYDNTRWRSQSIWRNVWYVVSKTDTKEKNSIHDDDQNNIYIYIYSELM